MFTTLEGCEFNIPGLLLSKGQRAWKLVFRELAFPWFYVSYTVQAEEVALEESVCIDLLDSLLQFERDQTACHVAITEIQLVSPSWLNGSDRWKMEPLKEVLRGREPAPSGQLVSVYVMHSGARYTSSIGASETDLSDLKRVFPACSEQHRERR